MKLRTPAQFFSIFVIFVGLAACNSDDGGDPPVEEPDIAPAADIWEGDVCESSVEECPGEPQEEPDVIISEEPDVVEEPDLSERTPEPEPDPTGHSNPKCSTNNLSSLLEIADADDDSFYKVAVHATPGSLDACSLGCSTAADCPTGICSEECCDLCWRALNIVEVGEEETATVTPEIRTTLNNTENWKCAPSECSDEPACTPLDLAARYIVWGQAVVPKGASETTLWVDDYCIETTPGSVIGTYEGDFTYDLLTVDANGRYEGKTGTQNIRVTVVEEGEALSANVEELSSRGDVYLKGSIEAGVSLDPDEGTMTLDLRWCLSDAEDCGDTKVVLHANRNNFIGNLNAEGSDSALGELKSLTLSVDRIFIKP